MPGTNMRVTTEELVKSANLIDDKTAKYDAEWAKLYTETANLRVDWQGQSSDVFNSQLEGYRNDFQELSKILKGYSEFLRRTAEKIDKKEAALKDAASKLNAGK